MRLLDPLDCIHAATAHIPDHFQGIEFPDPAPAQPPIDPTTETIRLLRQAIRDRNSYSLAALPACRSLSIRLKTGRPLFAAVCRSSNQSAISRAFRWAYWAHAADLGRKPPDEFKNGRMTSDFHIGPWNFFAYFGPTGPIILQFMGPQFGFTRLDDSIANVVKRQ